MARSPDPQTAAELLKAFSHPTRLAILQELTAGPKELLQAGFPKADK